MKKREFIAMKKFIRGLFRDNKGFGVKDREAIWLEYMMDYRERMLTSQFIFIK